MKWVYSSHTILAAFLLCFPMFSLKVFFKKNRTSPSQPKPLKCSVHFVSPWFFCWIVSTPIWCWCTFDLRIIQIKIKSFPRIRFIEQEWFVFTGWSNNVKQHGCRSITFHFPHSWAAVAETAWMKRGFYERLERTYDCSRSWQFRYFEGQEHKVKSTNV